MTTQELTTPMPEPEDNVQNPGILITRMTRMLEDMAGMLGAQRDLLAQRGMKLSAEPLDALRRFAGELQNLTRHLENQGLELSRLRELARTTQIINSALALEDILEDVMDTVIALVGAERGYVVLRGAEPESGAQEQDVFVARGIDQRDLESSEFSVSRTVVQRVAETGEPMVTLNAQEDERFARAESVVDYQLRSILCVPLRWKSEVLGVIYLDNRLRMGIFSEREQQLVAAFAGQAAIAIENARLFDRLRANLGEIMATKAFMDNVFASIGSGVIAADLDDQIMALNNAAAQILNIQRDDSVGQSLWSVLPTLYEGFERLVTDVRDHDRQQTVEVEPVLDRRGQINLNLKLSPFKDATQTTQGVAIVVDDLTFVKQQAAQLGVIRRYMTPAMLDNIHSIDNLELGGVEREISVVYCDVRGFTTFCEALPPEETMQVINRYLSVANEAIAETEGIIDKFMGDAVVALYNTQLNPQFADHPVRAVEAALRMAERVRTLHATLPPEQCLSYGIGIHTGSAVLGNVGSPRRKEFTAIGHTLEFVKLLQENALGGEILLSESTWSRVKDHVRAEALAPRKLRDQFDFSVMYRVSSAR